MAAIVSFAGDGTKENPMTVADVLAAEMNESTVWVKAYIVGNINGSKMAENIQFVAEGASASNLALADAQDEKNVANCIPLQLPTGDIRAALNLKDNPANLGKELLVQAKLMRYFGQNGLKEPAAFELSGEGVEPGPTTGIANTPETAYDVTKALEIIAAGQDLNTKVYVKGEVTGTPSISVQYGNAEYDITDGTSVLKVYRGNYLGNVKFESEDQLKEGDKVIVYGKLQLYQETPEFSAGNYIYSLNGVTKEEEKVDYSKIEAISIADFLQKADTKTMYKLTGKVANLVNTTYGNFDLVDQENDQVKIYIYGVVKQDDTANNKIWESLGVEEGDILTIVGTYTTYNDSPQIAKAVYISHQKGDAPGPVEVTTKTIAEVQAGENGKVKVEGTVVAVCARGAVIGDATGYIYVYDQNFASEVGDQVTIEGTTSTYGGFKQFSASAGYELTKTGTTTVSYPEPVVMDGAALDAWIEAPVIQYVQYTGMLSISGNYYNVSVEGAQAAQGSLVYLPEALKEGLADGDAITVTGFAMYISGSKYVNTVVTSISKGSGIEKVQKFNGSKAEAPVYDLSGRRVENPAKGLYIKAGKKIVVK